MADFYIRWSMANPKDLGVRPISPCWPPNAIWTNASIWMSYPSNHPDPAKQNATALTAQLGEQIVINVQVYTRGAPFSFPSLDQLTPLVCQVWACTGANGIGPISALPSSGGATGLQALVHGVIEVPDFYGTASVLWTPDAADGLVFDNGAAHICLAANLVYGTSPGAAGAMPASQGQRLPQFTPGGPGGQPVEIIFPCGDGPIDPLSAVPIGHFQGQKNIQVLTAESSLAIPLMFWAGEGDGGAHALTVTERLDRALVDAVILEHLLAHPMIDLRGGKPRRQRTRTLTSQQLKQLGADVDERLRGPVPVEPLERARLAGGGELVMADRIDIALRPARRALPEIAIEGDGVRGQSIKVQTKPHGPTRVVVDLKPAQADPAGVVRVFDVAERSPSGRLIGGTTIITVGLT